MDGAKVEITGVKSVINQLNKIDKELVKAFKENVNQIAQPAIEATAGRYRDVGVPLSGMANLWEQEGKSGARKKKFPYVADKAAASLKVKYDTRRNAVGVIVIQQNNPAAAIFEVAGRKNVNHLSMSLDQETSRGYKQSAPGRTKIMGPAIYRATRKGGTKEIQRLVKELEETLTRRIAAMGTNR
jgi:hypothetical protein